jgi:hypothetical protein
MEDDDVGWCQEQQVEMRWQAINGHVGIEGSIITAWGKEK